VGDRGFLARLDPSEREALDRMGRHRRYGAGQVLFLEGDEGRDVFLLCDGLVKVVTTSVSGRQVILDLVPAGAVLGELSAIDGQARSASVEALTSIDVLILRVEDFRMFLQTQPRVAVELLEVMAARLRASSQRQLEFGTSDAMTRLCRCLLVMIDRFGGWGSEPSVSLPITQQDMAALTGLSREAVVKALHRLRELGWVEASGRTIAIRDMAAVEERAR
jgi:CRP/FNR family cyclic AMP-dependent transcriptional regulator